MNGIELSEAFFLEYGKTMLEEKFGDKLNKIAVGIAGQGSECFGYDDEFSRDHDYQPGFAVWINEETEREIGFALERAYSALPRSYKGVSLRCKTGEGPQKFGVMTVDSFFRNTVGRTKAPTEPMEWFYLPEYAVANAVNGKMFFDGEGEMTARRNRFLFGMPEDVRLQKLAARLALMAQAGTYNYPRILKHSETGAARMAIYEYVQNAVSACFLIAGVWKPFYKWQFRALRNLPCLSDTEPLLTSLLVGENEEKTVSDMEAVNNLILTELSCEGESLDRVSQELHGKIQDRAISSLHLLDYGND